MKNFLRSLFIIPFFILVVALLTGVFSGKEKTAKKHPRPTIGEKARDFAYPDLNGKSKAFGLLWQESDIFEYLGNLVYFL